MKSLDKFIAFLAEGLQRDLRVSAVVLFFTVYCLLCAVYCFLPSQSIQQIIAYIESEERTDHV
jgi:uncharacterized BrkB/YihY/UPF0761 family membrane protein